MKRPAPQGETANKSFLLQVIQPGLAGLMDGSVSTLAPIFATAFVRYRFFASSFFVSAVEVIVGGALVFTAGVLIGSS